MTAQLLECDGYQFPVEDVLTLETQKRLAIARANAAPLRCLCRSPGLRMVIRQFRTRLFVARWPDTGELHHPDCPSFDLDSHSDAVLEHEDGAIEFRVSFPLSAKPSGHSDRSSKAPLETPAATTPSGSPVSHHSALDLGGVLHELWRLSGLDKWVPAMANVRQWWRVRYFLTQAALPVQLGQEQLTDFLFLPEPYRSNDLLHEQLQMAALRKIIADHGVAILIAPIRSVAPSRYGFQIGFTHLPKVSAFANTDFGCPEQLQLLRDGDRLMGIAILDARSHYFRILEMASFPINANWLPFDTAVEATVIDGLVADQQRILVRHGRTRIGEELAVRLLAGQPIERVLLIDGTRSGIRFEQISTQEQKHER